MNIIQHPSPNFDSRDGQAIDMLVLHYTGMKTGIGALEKLCDPSAEVSAHYVVEEDGRVLQLVDEKNRAWHAGVSFWRGHTNINQRSIGIEIVNPGHEYGYHPFSIPQMEAVIALCQDIVKRHKIPARNVVGHSDVAPTRKQDPGELFDWEWLAQMGIGHFTSPSPLEGEGRGGGQTGYNSSRITPLPNPSGSLAPSPQGGRELAEYGYDITNLPAAITAFQRHFRRKSLTGKWDSECSQILDLLLAAKN